MNKNYIFVVVGVVLIVAAYSNATRLSEAPLVVEEGTQNKTPLKRGDKSRVKLSRSRRARTNTRLFYIQKSMRNLSHLSGVNTPGGEDSPFITPDGATLYFFLTPDVSIPVERQLFDGVTGIWASIRLPDGT